MEQMKVVKQASLLTMQEDMKKVSGCVFWEIYNWIAVNDAESCVPHASSVNFEVAMWMTCCFTFPMLRD